MSDSLLICYEVIKILAPKMIPCAAPNGSLLLPYVLPLALRLPPTAAHDYPLEPKTINLNGTEYRFQLGVPFFKYISKYEHYFVIFLSNAFFLSKVH